MQGPADNRGVNFRALSNLFEIAAARVATHTYDLEISLLEIYNETVHDCLVQTERGAAKEALDVRRGPDGNFVPGLTWRSVSSYDDVVAVLMEGEGNRSTFSNNFNEHSSRSHLVVSIRVNGHNKATGKSLRGIVRGIFSPPLFFLFWFSFSFLSTPSLLLLLSSSPPPLAASAHRSRGFRAHLEDGCEGAAVGRGAEHQPLPLRAGRRRRSAC